MNGVPDAEEQHHRVEHLPQGPLLDRELHQEVEGEVPVLLGDVHDADGPVRQFNKQNFGLSFGLKNGLRFHFDSETCLTYPFFNIFLV